MVIQTDPAPGLEVASVCLYHGTHRARVITLPVPLEGGGWAIMQRVAIVCPKRCGARAVWVSPELLADCRCSQG